MNLDPGVIGRLRLSLTPRAWLRVTPLKYVATPLGMGFGETRFASPSRAFRTLYLGRTLTTAIAETIVRDRFVGRRRRMVTQDEIEGWGVSEIAATAALSLLDLRGAGPFLLGVPTNVVRGKAQGPGRRFSEALYVQALYMDGVLYPSRLTNETCIAIYDRAVTKLQASPLQPLVDQPGLTPALAALNVTVLAR